MPFRLIFFHFAKCDNSIEVPGHENMILTRRMAHACTELHKKVKFYYYFHILRITFSHLADLVSLTHLALICLTHLADLVSLTHLADLLLTHLALI